MKKFLDFLIAIIGIFLGGLAIMYLWEWFITPFGLMSIGIFHAMGIDLLITFITYQINSFTVKPMEDKTSYEEVFIRTSIILNPIIYLACGYLIQLGMNYL